MPRLFLMLIACNLTRACGTPAGTGGDTATVDSDSATDTTETVETGETADTAPPPMCDQIELEPNDYRIDASPIAMTPWACGTFYDPDENDFDYLTFDLVRGNAAGPTWLEVAVEASNRASVADPELIVYGPDDEPFLVEDFNRGTDPYVVFPVEEDGTWDLGLYEKYAGSGEDYAWFLRVLIGKQPVDFDDVEVEPNDSTNDSLAHLSDGDRVFGTVGETYDLDWFIFQSQPDQDFLTVSVLANNYGSPLDARLAVYNSAGGTLEVATQGIGDSYDKDPVVSVAIDPSESYYITVRIDTDRSTQVGGRAYWYVLDLAVTDQDLTD
jgi:hypothetical protein